MEQHIKYWWGDFNSGLFWPTLMLEQPLKLYVIIIFMISYSHWTKSCSLTFWPCLLVPFSSWDESRISISGRHRKMRNIRLLFLFPLLAPGRSQLRNISRWERYYTDSVQEIFPIVRQRRKWCRVLRKTGSVLCGTVFIVY